MPPKIKFTKEEIVAEAFEIVRKDGWNNLSSRTIAGRLKCSTMPIYFHFKSMEQLEEEIVKKALDLLMQYQLQDRTGDPLLNAGLGYILFAQEEKALFRGVTDEKHADLFRRLGKRDFQYMSDFFRQQPQFKKISPELMRQFLFIEWVLMHGLACLTNTIPLSAFEGIDTDILGLLQRMRSIFDDELIIKRLMEVESQSQKTKTKGAK